MGSSRNWLPKPPEPSIPISSAPKPWGFWTTLLFSLVTLVAFLVIQTVVTIAYIVVMQMVEPARQGELARNIDNYNGLLISIAGWSSMLFCFGLTLLWVKLRGQLSICDYLAIHRRPLKHFLIGAAVVAVLIALCDTTTYLLGYEARAKRHASRPIARR